MEDDYSFRLVGQIFRTPASRRVASAAAAAGTLWDENDDARRIFVLSRQQKNSEAAAAASELRVAQFVPLSSFCGFDAFEFRALSPSLSPCRSACVFWPVLLDVGNFPNSWDFQLFFGTEFWSVGKSQKPWKSGIFDMRCQNRFKSSKKGPKHTNIGSNMIIFL